MKLEVVVDAQGIPLGTVTAAANVAETALAEPVLDDVPIDLPAGIPLLADKGYDSDALRDAMEARHLKLISPHRNRRVRSSRNDGRCLRRYARRYIVERTNSWLHSFRRLINRWEYYTFMYDGFVRLACIMIAFRRL